LVEDETMVKARVAYEQKWDTLSSFCGPKTNHEHISGFKLVVGLGVAGYNPIVNGFCTSKVGNLARVGVVNPLHKKLPRLVMVCLCNM
jgi:hypothetical protein